ncbi:MAG: hypothetical protein GF388_10075 [Candidatus Aegiribacteria sp.]|nr:hypothetical protein [Candidatus Aegiribacteria sp.]MBD3295379.1 hypothetical protein [Candidatus Fermentibacteria bacterium]
MNDRLIWGVWLAAAVAVAATVTVMIGVNRRAGSEAHSSVFEEDSLQDREVAVRVDSTILYMDEIRIAGAEPAMVAQWVEDQLLADMAVQRGYENTVECRLIMERARQLYLRDELLNHVYSSVPFPDSGEVYDIMASDSAAYLVERHYFQILVANESMADSVYQRLELGENFQILAERLSLGQKAGIGGDMGYLTAGELMFYGIPANVALLEEGHGEPVESPYGWHILLVDDIRQMEDTVRAVRSLAEGIYRNRLEALRDSLVQLEVEQSEIYISPRITSEGISEPNYQDQDHTMEEGASE